MKSLAMKLLFLLYLLVWGLPQVAKSQIFNKFEPGSYVLANNPTVRLQGQLKLRGSYQLLVKNALDKTLKLKPSQVSSFWLGSRKFITTSGVNGNDEFGSLDSVKTFVELLDSGQVMLLRYTFVQGTAAPIGGGGAMIGSGSIAASFYLLQWPTEDAAVPTYGLSYIKGQQRFQDTMQQFFISRPDLLKMLAEKRITDSNIDKAVHALNRHLLFNP